MKVFPVSFQNALSFLTILPFPCALLTKNPAQSLAQTFVWFPWVGALIGGIGGGIAFLASSRWSPGVGSFLGLIGMVILTGGLHLDGFSDTLDGLASFKGRKETIQVMRDSHIGAIGAAGLFLILGLKWSLIQSISLERLIPSLVASCSLSRLMLVLSARSFPYVPGESGLGKLVTDHRSPSSVLIAILGGVAVAVAAVGPFMGGFCVMLAAAVMWGINCFFLARLGGITGDTLGAVNEVVEASLLLFLAIP